MHGISPETITGSPKTREESKRSLQRLSMDGNLCINGRNFSCISQISVTYEHADGVARKQLVLRVRALRNMPLEIGFIIWNEIIPVKGIVSFFWVVVQCPVYREDNRAFRLESQKELMESQRCAFICPITLKRFFVFKQKLEFNLSRK